MQTQRTGADTGRTLGPPPPATIALGGLIVLSLLVASLPASGQATAFDYAPGRCTINAAVLSFEVWNGTNVTTQWNQNRGLATYTTDPGIMEALRRASFRPPHWDIVNPRGTTDNGGAYTPEGSQPYWDVVLSWNRHSDLRRYNLLYVCASNLRVLTVFQVDSLLEAVQDGAVLWIDSAHPTATGNGAGGTPWETSPCFFALTNGTLTVATLNVDNHALVTRPFRLTTTQMQEIGAAGATDSLNVSVNLPYLRPILLGAGGATVVAAGRYGSGAFVVTGGDLGAEITGANWATPGGAEVPSFLFAYDVMAWATGWTQARQSPRGSGASIGEVRLDLDVRWQSPTLGPVAGSPVIDDSGREFAVSYGPTARLYCYDSDPAEDMGGDGNADDSVPNPPNLPANVYTNGIGDYAGGDGPDLIWSRAMPGSPRSTSPTVAVRTVLAGGNSTVTDVVLVSLISGGIGSVNCYEAATGALVWSRTLPTWTGAASAETVSVSTPVVHNGYVYVVGSEYDPAGPGPNPVDNCYGRVYVFDLATGGASANGYWWLYPDPTNAPAASLGLAQYRMALPPVDDPTWVVPPATPPRSELPLTPTPVPSIGNAPYYRTALGSGPTFEVHLDAVMYFGTPVARQWGPTNAPVTLATQGADYALVPTPANVKVTGNKETVTLPSPDPFPGNRRHYQGWLRALESLPPEPPGAAPTAKVTGVTTYYSPGEAGRSEITLAEPVATVLRPFVQYPTRDVEKFLAALPNGNTLPGAPPDPQPPAPPPYYGVQAGCPVQSVVAYQDDTGANKEAEERALLPGPVLFYRQYTATARRVAGQSVSGVVAGAAQLGGVTALDPASGEMRWTYDPGSAFEWTAAGAAGAEGAPADTGNTIVGVATQLISVNEGFRGLAFGLDSRPDVTIRTGAAIPRTPTVVVNLVGGGALTAVDPAYYRIDYENGRITFPGATAGNVGAAPPPAAPALGPVYGRMLVINGTVFGAPDLARWEYAPGPAGTIRLKHHPVRWSGTGVTSPTARLADGLPVTGFTAGEALMTVGGVDWLPTGLINCAGAVTYRTVPGTPPTTVNEVPVPRGAELLFTYQGLAPDGPLAVPNGYEPAERHQVPYAFGRPLAGPAAANDGQTAVMGTESFALGATGAGASLTASPFVGAYYWDPTNATPAQFEGDPTRTLLALSWDKVVGNVRGRLARPVWEPPQDPIAPRVPLVSSSPAIDGEAVHVGSRILNTLPTVPTYGGAATDGYVSALAPARTLITDDQRIVETVGSRVDWICTGTRAIDWNWDNTDAQGNANWPNNAPVRRVPFSRPAKAVELTREDFLEHGTLAVPNYPRESGVGAGNYLVVDTGSNRVVEVDRQGRQVWPLILYPTTGVNPWRTRRTTDGLGFDYYNSPRNNLLSLDQPTDAYRYWRHNGATWEMHTVIADSGHFRVVDVDTTFSFRVPDSVRQDHAVTVVTPTHITSPASTRPGERIRVAYTKAVPLFDPGNGAVVGYLCAASNLHELLVVEAGTGRVDPPGTDALPGGTAGATWSMWSWLYDRNLDSNAATDERLIFENLRDVRVSPLMHDIYGAQYVFLTVVCGRYRGPLAFPYAVTVNGTEAGSICLDFRIGYNSATNTPGLDPTAPATWVLRPPGDVAANWYVPCWYYTDRDYQAGPLGQCRLPYTPGPGVTPPALQPKAFTPVSCQRLGYGRHLVANYFGLIPNLVHANLPTRTAFDTPPSLTSDVFEVETRYITVGANTTQRHLIDVHKAIPDPWDDEWTDPFNQPSYAQRCLDSPGPARP